MSKLNPDQQYLVEEFYEDYRAGQLTRREFIRRVAFITGSMAATVATMGLMGCSPEELPDPTAPMPTPVPPTAAVSTAVPTGAPTAAPTIPPTTAPTATAEASPAAALVPVPGAQSPLSVPEGDPAVVAESIIYERDGVQLAAYLAQPVEGERLPAVLVCHENRGLTAHIRDVARRFAKAGYVALAPDLLSREGGSENLDSDQVPGLLGAAGSERHVADFSAAYSYLQSLDMVDGARIAMTGYCFGGGVTWDVATSLPELRAAVPFYGRAPDLAAVANIRATVLAVYAGLDSRINAGIPALEEAMKAAGVTYQINIYPGVDHAFHNDTGSRYVEAQATQAWQDTLEWFAQFV